MHRTVTRVGAAVPVIRGDKYRVGVCLNGETYWMTPEKAQELSELLAFQVKAMKEPAR